LTPAGAHSACSESSPACLQSICVWTLYPSDMLRCISSCIYFRQHRFCRGALCVNYTLYLSAIVRHARSLLAALLAVCICQCTSIRWVYFVLSSKWRQNKIKWS
jgi:hypothetical protein